MIVCSAIVIERVIFRGKRHADAFKAAAAAGVPQAKTASQFVKQGFMTDDDRFLDRHEAGEHAIACGQITTLKWPHVGLNSEDLW